jgi:hypothetical protein
MRNDRIIERKRGYGESRGDGLSYEVDRQFAVEELEASAARLLEVTDGLSKAQWTFHKAPERWSIAENVEHLILFEGFIRGAVEQALSQPAQPEKSAAVAEKHSRVMGLVDVGDQRLVAREVARPRGLWPERDAATAEFRRVRAETVEFILATNAELRNHFFPHISFGDLDCYQWMLLLGRHALRHVKQIEAVKQDPRFPPV